MLYSWGMLKKNGAVVGKPKSLVQAVTESRPQGKLSYLIGKVYLNNYYIFLHVLNVCFFSYM